MYLHSAFFANSHIVALHGWNKHIVHQSRCLLPPLLAAAAALYTRQPIVSDLSGCHAWGCREPASRSDLSSPSSYMLYIYTHISAMGCQRASLYIDIYIYIPGSNRQRDILIAFAQPTHAARRDVTYTAHRINTHNARQPPSCRYSNSTPPPTYLRARWV